MERLNALKDLDPNLKTLLGYGGWTMGMDQVTEILADPLKRTEFVQTTKQTVKDFGFDGVSLGSGISLFLFVFHSL